MDTFAEHEAIGRDMKSDSVCDGRRSHRGDEEVEDFWVEDFGLKIEI